MLLEKEAGFRKRPERRLLRFDEDVDVGVHGSEVVVKLHAGRFSHAARHDTVTA